MLYWEDNYLYDTENCTRERMPKIALRKYLKAGIWVYGVTFDLNAYAWRDLCWEKLSILMGVKVECHHTEHDVEVINITGNFGVIDSTVISSFKLPVYLTLNGSGVLHVSLLSFETEVSDSNVITLATSDVRVDISSAPYLDKCSWASILEFPRKNWLLASYFTDYKKAPLLSSNTHVFADNFVYDVALNDFVFDLPFSDLDKLLRVLKPYTDAVVNFYRSSFDEVLGMSFELPRGNYSGAFNHVRDSNTGRYILTDIYRNVSHPEISRVINIIDWFSHDNELIAKTYNHLCSFLR